MELSSEIQSEMTIKIPQSYSSKFANFFEKFDSSLGELNIQSYGISISTLEEVFLRIGHLEDPTGIKVDKDVSNTFNTKLAQVEDMRINQ